MTGKSRKRRLTSMVSVRFMPDEEQAIRAAAAEHGQSMSDFLRQAAIRVATGPRCAECERVDDLAFVIITGQQVPTVHFGAAPFGVTGAIRWAGWRCRRCCMRDYGVFALEGYVA
jgi:hypothetical protein